MQLAKIEQRSCLMNEFVRDENPIPKSEQFRKLRVVQELWMQRYQTLEVPLLKQIWSMRKRLLMRLEDLLFESMGEFIHTKDFIYLKIILLKTKLCPIRHHRGGWPGDGNNRRLQDASGLCSLPRYRYWSNVSGLPARTRNCGPEEGFFFPKAIKTSSSMTQNGSEISGLGFESAIIFPPGGSGSRKEKIKNKREKCMEIGKKCNFIK